MAVQGRHPSLGVPLAPRRSLCGCGISDRSGSCPVHLRALRAVSEDMISVEQPPRCRAEQRCAFCLTESVLDEEKPGPHP